MGKTANFLNKNKATIKKIILCIGAITIIMTPVMGLVGCDEARLGKEENLTYEEYQAVFAEMIRTELPDLNISELELYSINFSYNSTNKEESGLECVCGLIYLHEEASKLLTLNIVFPLDCTESFQAWKKSYKEQFPPESFVTIANNHFQIEFRNLNDQQIAEAVKFFYDLSLDHKVLVYYRESSVFS